MNPIERTARLAISIYIDYCARGLSSEAARDKAVKEAAERWASTESAPMPIPRHESSLCVDRT
jgi:hypothetical protein